MYQILIYIVILFSSIYLLNIARFILGFIKNNNNIYQYDKLPPISVIIAVKNGEKNLHRMLDQLSKQTYSGDMEFIIVNDKSTDNTKKIINDYCIGDIRFKYVSSKQGASYLNHKKKALDAGIKSSRYEHLLFTDIDCIIQLKWIDSMAACFSKEVDYIVGHAYVSDRKSILNKFQRVDLFMLLFSAKATISLNTPWASTGQNQGYTRTLYNKLCGFKKLASYLQGDDTLFLQLAVKNGANIIFNNNPDSYVISRTELSWKSLLYQRGRWSGDANLMWKFNLLFYLMAVSLWVMSISLISLLFLNQLDFLIIILLFKIILEGLLYSIGMVYFKEDIKYNDFLFWFIMHPIYVFIMGIFSFSNFKWKGKAIR